MFANYAELYDEVLQWMDRYDDEFVARLPAFSRLVEQSTLRDLRVPSMEKVALIEVDKNGRINVPADLLEPKTLSICKWDFIPSLSDPLVGEVDVTSRAPLRRVQEKLSLHDVGGKSSTPTSYGRVGVNEYQLSPYSRRDLSGGEGITVQYEGTEYNTDADIVEFVYYSLYQELSEEDTSNWLLLVAPELYLHGMLYYASLFVRDEEQANLWKERYASAKNALQEQANRSEEAGGYINIPRSL